MHCCGKRKHSETANYSIAIINQVEGKAKYGDATGGTAPTGTFTDELHQQIKPRLRMVDFRKKGRTVLYKCLVVKKKMGELQKL
jgi:hypothetical protein